jgi:hypothetical protein
VPRWSTATTSKERRNAAIRPAKRSRAGIAGSPGPPVSSTSVPVRVPVAGSFA